MKSMKNYCDKAELLLEAINSSNAVLLGAGAGLSTSAGISYEIEGELKDFASAYGFSNMYEAGFYPFKSAQHYWAYWSLHIDKNRYGYGALPLYRKLFELLKNKEHFVITTNVDAQFALAGFKNVFAPQGDYGLFQCSKPCSDMLWSNEEEIKRMKAEIKDFKIKTPPKCLRCEALAEVNIRKNASFVQDSSWYEKCQKYEQFLTQHLGLSKLLLLELGVGFNTPGIIKFPLLRMARAQNTKYLAINTDAKALLKLRDMGSSSKGSSDSKDSPGGPDSKDSPNSSDSPNSPDSPDFLLIKADISSLLSSF